jgi:hypothetical protein
VRIKMHIGYCWERHKKRDNYEDQDVGRLILLKWILGWSCMDWIDLAQDRDQWRTLLNTVMILRDP